MLLGFLGTQQQKPYREEERIGQVAYLEQSLQEVSLLHQEIYKHRSHMQSFTDVFISTWDNHK